MSRLPSLLLRVDAGERVGLGHAMRCLAIAQAAVDAGHAVAVATTGLGTFARGQFSLESAAIEEIDVEPGSVADAERTVAVARARGADWVVVDGYAFQALFRSAVRASGLRLVVIDDGPLGDAGADAGAWVVPGLVRADATLSGLDAVLLRREVRSFAARAPEGPDDPCAAGDVLVTLGGSTLDELHRAIGSAVQPLLARRARVTVVGAPRSAYSAGVNVLPLVPDLERLVARASVVVTTSGSMVWEVAALARPAVLLVVAANQEPVAQRAAELFGYRSIDARMGVAQIGTSLVAMVDAAAVAGVPPRATRPDGLGVDRVLSIVGLQGVRLRAAGVPDAELLFAWANDPATRAMSFSSATIEWEEHLAWLTGRLNNDNALTLIAELDSQPIGVVRFDRDGTSAEIGITIAPPLRGRGHAPTLIRAGSATARRRWPIVQVNARLRGENKASRAAFQRAGYLQGGMTEIRGIPAERWCWRVPRAEAS